MSGVDTARLAELLGSPALARLIERARDKLAQGSALDAVVTLRRPSHEERAAVDRLLGRPPSRGASVTLPLGRIDAILRHAEIAPSLGEALIALGGPLVDGRRARADAEARWAEMFAAAERQLSHPAALRWLAEIRATGLLRRLSQGDEARGARTLADEIAARQSILDARERAVRCRRRALSLGVAARPAPDPPRRGLRRCQRRHAQQVHEPAARLRFRLRHDLGARVGGAVRPCRGWRSPSYRRAPGSTRSGSRAGSGTVASACATTHRRPA